MKDYSNLERRTVVALNWATVAVAILVAVLFVAVITF